MHLDGQGFRNRGDIGLDEAKDARADLFKGLEKHDAVRLGARGEGNAMTVALAGLTMVNLR